MVISFIKCARQGNVTRIRFEHWAAEKLQQNIGFWLTDA